MSRCCEPLALDAAGVLLGTLLAVMVRGEALTAVFAVVALLVALNMGFTAVDWRLHRQLPRRRAAPRRSASSSGPSAP
jgi:uncharacterized membrane protein YfcA